METWEEFKKYQRYHTGGDALDFYGCVDKDGMWFDSAASFDIAVHFCRSEEHTSELQSH